MKYFIADIEAEGAVAQVGSSRVEELPGGRLRYRASGATDWRIAETGAWSRQWDKAARAALELLAQAAVNQPEQATRFLGIRAALLSSSEELRRAEQQLGLFGPGSR